MGRRGAVCACVGVVKGYAWVKVVRVGKARRYSMGLGKESGVGMQEEGKAEKQRR